MKIKLNILKTLGIVFLATILSGTVYAAITTNILTADSVVADGLKLTKTYSCVVDTDSDRGDYTKIQDCVDYLSGTGGTIYIRNGTYTISDEIQLTSNITIIGAGKGNTIIIPTGNAAHNYKAMFNLAGTTGQDGGNNENIEISHMTIDTNNTNNGIGCRNISDNTTFDTVTVYDVRIHDLEIVNGGTVQANLMTLDVDGGYVKNCYFNDTQGGAILTKPSINFQIKDNFIENTGDDGIALSAKNGCAKTGERVVVSGNVVDNSGASANSGGSGIKVLSTDHVVVSNNVLKNNEEGIRVSDVSVCDASRYVVVDGNEIYNSTLTGIAATMGTDSLILRNVVISNNLVTDSDQQGMVIGGGEYITVTGNIIKDSSEGGIRLMAQLDNATLNYVWVTNNQILNTSGAAIYSYINSNEAWDEMDNIYLLNNYAEDYTELYNDTNGALGGSRGSNIFKEWVLDNGEMYSGLVVTNTTMKAADDGTTLCMECYSDGVCNATAGVC